MANRYASLVSTKRTPQSEKIPGSKQVKNSAGGYSFKVDNFTRLERFLILGSEGGSYYAKERKLTQENAKGVLKCIEEDGLETVRRIIAVSREGRAPKNDPAIFALALAATFGNEETKSAALTGAQEVCRIGTHLFQFAAACNELRGWGSRSAPRHRRVVQHEEPARRGLPGHEVSAARRLVSSRLAAPGSPAL